MLASGTEIADAAAAAGFFDQSHPIGISNVILNDRRRTR
jgi:hypothetical protein